MAARRCHAIVATRAPVAAAIVRGPARWRLVCRWDLARGEVEPGAWFRGTLHAHRCDLSPDGELLLYVARKRGRPTRR